MVSILGFAGHLVAVKNYLALLWYQESSHRQLTRKRRSTAVVQLNSVYTNRQLAVPVGHSLPATVLDLPSFYSRLKSFGKHNMTKNTLSKGMVL